MFQKEVADRILAEPGSKTYGRISVLAQWRCTVQRAFDLPPKAFVPPPKVDSTVLSFAMRSAPHRHRPPYSRKGNRGGFRPATKDVAIQSQAAP